MQPSQQHLNVLKTFFGHSHFRAKQWEIIHSLLEDKRDHCVVMATGQGKSLCYQFPPVFSKKVAFVVSPLISLMKDQVLALQMCNIKAVVLGSAQDSKSSVTNALENEDVRLIYASPEWTSGSSGTEFIQKLHSSKRLGLIAIDEAHCVSQWGHDFRKAYRQLSCLRSLAPRVPFIAVTATATPLIVDDICNSLHLRNPIIVKTSFDRYNLYLSVSPKGESPVKDIIPLIQQEMGQNNGIIPPTIIYCPTKQKADDLGELLSENDLPCAVYHAGIGLKERERVQNEFTRDIVPIVIATVAFGMGINKPDVRLVIHYGPPRELESYYQEVGRAGRDGLPSTCRVFYSPGDLRISRMMVRSGSNKIVKHKEAMLRHLEGFLSTGQCRWARLLSHLDPDAPPPDPRPRCCDNCTHRPLGNDSNVCGYDPRPDVVLLLKAVREFSGNYGLTIPVYLLRGSSNKRLPPSFRTHTLFGAGLHQTEQFWKCLGRVLIGEGLLEEVSSNYGRGWNKNQFPVHVLVLTKHGMEYLRKDGNGVASIEITPELLKIAKPKEIITSDNWLSRQLLSTDSDVPIADLDPAVIKEKSLETRLYQDLYQIRGEIAAEVDAMPYMICSNRTLLEMSQKKPTELSLLNKYDGFTEAKVAKFGQKMIDCVKKHLNETENASSSLAPNPAATKKFFKKAPLKSTDQTVSLVGVVAGDKSTEEWGEDDVDWNQVLGEDEPLPNSTDAQRQESDPSETERLFDNSSEPNHINLVVPISPSSPNETQEIPELCELPCGIPEANTNEDILAPISPRGGNWMNDTTMNQPVRTADSQASESQWFSALESQECSEKLSIPQKKKSR